MNPEQFNCQMKASMFAELLQMTWYNWLQKNSKTMRLQQKEYSATKKLRDKSLLFQIWTIKSVQKASLYKIIQILCLCLLKKWNLNLLIFMMRSWKLNCFWIYQDFIDNLNCSFCLSISRFFWSSMYNLIF